MTMLLRLAVACLIAAPLAACQDKPAEQKMGQTRAEGKILERSVTDDMIPYDTIRSQAPLAQQAADDTAIAGSLDDEQPKLDGE